MVVDFGIGETVRQLRRAGYRPSEHLVKTILKSGPAAFSPLLELATNCELLHDDEPDCYAPLHALRLLGELPEPAMIAPLFDEIPLPLYYPDEQLPQSWVSEAQQMVARLGAAAIAPLWAYADSTEKQPQARGTALLSLSYVAVVAPEQRAALVAQLRERLRSSEDAQINGFLVAALADLGVAEAYNEIRELYRAGKVTLKVMTFSDARQLLLSKGAQELVCANHTLWERYDVHGPFPHENTV